MRDVVTFVRADTCLTPERARSPRIVPCRAGFVSDRRLGDCWAVNALRHRNFRLLFAARTISFFGTNLVPIAVAFAVLDIGGSVTAVGVAFGARTFAQIAALLVGGVVADRFPRRAVMIGSDLASLAIQTLMGALLVTGNGTVWRLVVLQAAGGAAAAFHSPASTGLVPQTVPPDALQQANGFMSIARYSAAIFGAAAGGVLVATIGAGWAILLDGASYAASALLLAAMRVPGLAKRLAKTHPVRDLVEGWQAFVEHTWVWLLAAWIAVFFLISTRRSSCSGRTSRSRTWAAPARGRPC